MKQRAALLHLRLGDSGEDVERIRESLACSPSLPPETVRQLTEAVATFLDHRRGDEP